LSYYNLYIGDYHAHIDELDECRRLGNLICKVVAEWPEFGLPLEKVVFLGDQYHNHSIVHVEVMHFWRNLLADLHDELYQINEDFDPKDRIILMLGNHDKPHGKPTKAHALRAHADQAIVVDQPYFYKGVLFCPYYDKPEELAECARSYAGRARTLVCHQTFQGSTYENGFYAKDGIDPELFPQAHIVSGHIHRPQKFGKVWYPGAPRWRTLSDANTDRAIYVVKHADTGEVEDAMGIETSPTCERIVRVESTPEHPWDGGGVKVGRTHLDIKGPPTFIAEQKKYWMDKSHWLPGQTVLPKGVPVEDRAVIKVRESEGLEKSFDKYLQSYSPKHGTPRSVLEEMVRKRFNGIHA
jgi:DNA repair exonuclease SbcCD nuclease subunit